MDLNIVTADLENSDHQAAVLSLLNAYALELPGYAKPLSDRVYRELIPEMRKMPTAHVFLAKAGGKYIGLAVCFVIFSTFHARPVINIHDFAVGNGHRGKGVGSSLLRAVEEKAKELRCCKITLEVQEKNTGAIALYERYGFRKAVLDESEGMTFFLSKVIEGELQ